MSYWLLKCEVTDIAVLGNLDYRKISTTGLKIFWFEKKLN